MFWEEERRKRKAFQTFSIVGSGEGWIVFLRVGNSMVSFTVVRWKNKNKESSKKKRKS